MKQVQLPEWYNVISSSITSSNQVVVMLQFPLLLFLPQLHHLFPTQLITLTECQSSKSWTRHQSWRWWSTNRCSRIRPSRHHM